MGSNKTEIQIKDWEEKDWKYKIDYTRKKNNIPSIEVTNNDINPLPKTLSKYYSLDDNSVGAFINNRIYLAQPNQMNDLFELNAKSFKYSSLTVLDLAKYGLFKSKEEYLEAENDSKNDPNFFATVINTMHLNYMLRFGIFCTTINQKGDLMWAHYSNNSGFLIEFDYSQFPQHFWGPFPINYCRKEQLDIKEVDWNLALYAESLTKKDVWKYENEYRFLFYPSNQDALFRVNGNWAVQDETGFNLIDRYIHYPTSAVKKVILGIKILEGSEEVKGYSNRRRFNDFQKIAFLNKLCESSFPVEVLQQRMDLYELQTSKVEFTKVEEGVFDFTF